MALCPIAGIIIYQSQEELKRGIFQNLASPHLLVSLLKVYASYCKPQSVMLNHLPEVINVLRGLKYSATEVV